VTSGMLFTESATAYMGGIRAVVGASIEEEEAAGSLPSAPPAAAIAQPRPAGPAGDAATKEAADDLPSAPLAVAVQPEPASDVAARGASLQETTLGPCNPLTVCIGQDVAPPLDTGEDSPADMQRLPVTGNLPEP
jgi:hypothetical protein